MTCPHTTKCWYSARFDCSTNFYYAYLCIRHVFLQLNSGCAAVLIFFSKCLFIFHSFSIALIVAPTISFNISPIMTCENLSAFKWLNSHFSIVFSLKPICRLELLKRFPFSLTSAWCLWMTKKFTGFYAAKLKVVGFLLPPHSAWLSVCQKRSATLFHAEFVCSTLCTSFSALRSLP